MKCIVLLANLISAIGINIGFASHPSDSIITRLGYTDSLNQVVRLFKEGKIPSRRLTEYSIPENDEEAHLFFQLDYKNESTIEFGKLLKHIESLCIKGQETTIKKFIPLSQFVDGYFAEDYFHSAERICKSRPKTFCKVFRGIDLSKKERLVTYGITCNKR